MSVPLTATARIEFKYVIAGMTHRLNTYMAYNDVIGQHQMVDRDGITTVLWTVGAQKLWDAIRTAYVAASLTAPAQISLFQRAGTLWNLIDVATLTGIGSGSGTQTLASQFTLVVRDTAFKKMRFVLLELSQGYAGHDPLGMGISGIGNTITQCINGVNGNANDAYRWMKSRGDRFIAATGAIAGGTLDMNDKLKRARGLA
jgi:hypothetical protein